MCATDKTAEGRCQVFLLGNMFGKEKVFNLPTEINKPIQCGFLCLQKRQPNTISGGER